MIHIPYPQAEEYAPYYHTYIGLLEHLDISRRLQDQLSEIEGELSGLSEKTELFRYDEGKWSVREVVGHIIDTERIMAYRALRIGRGDLSPLPGFDQDVYVTGANYDQIPLSRQLAMFRTLRQSSCDILEGMTSEDLKRIGTASGHPVSPRALFAIIVGHFDHHMRIVRERYLR
ncbi:MAG: DinB family protein [Bacteroidota bacterium]